MFHKRYKRQIFEIVFFTGILFFFLNYKNSLFTHWSYALDQDITIIYNSILLSSKINQEYLDHPAYSTMFMLNLVYQICFQLNISKISSITDLINSQNKNEALQNLYNISLTVHLIYSILFLYLVCKILNKFIKDRTSSFLLTNIVIFSPAFIHLFDIIRSEILSIIFCFFYYLFLNKSLKNDMSLIISGFFLAMAMLAKVQIIFCIFGFLFIFFLENFSKVKKENYISISFLKKNLKIINLKIILINIIFTLFMIFFCLKYFYKVIDGIFFIFFFLSHFFILMFLKKKTEFITTPIIKFTTGIIIALILMKYFSEFTGIPNSLHPEIIKVISNPISISANIASSFKFTEVDKIDFIFKLIEFIKRVPESGFVQKAQLNIILNNLSIITYFLSILVIFFNYKNKKKNIFYLLFLNLIITFLNLIFSIRPYEQYLIYSYTFNLILISIILKENFYRKYFAGFILFAYLFLNFSNINISLNEKREYDGNMKYICRKDILENNDTYMRYWHRRFDKNFLYDLCNSFYHKN